MLLLFACTASPDSTWPTKTDTDVGADSGADSGTDTSPGTDTDSGTDTDVTPTGALTLDTCEGTVDDDVPEPYATWFRCADLATDGAYLAVHSDDLPPHPSPYYDTSSENWTAFDDRGGDWHQNPNTIAAQDLILSIPLDPTPKGITITADMVDESAGTHDEEYRGEFQGVGLDGTALFTGVAAPGDSIADEEYTFDLYEGHPTDRGTYHHHGANPAALAVLSWLGVDDVEVYGVMCDGTVVLGCDELDGTSPGTLDAQNGHLGEVGDWGERYHVHACEALGRTLTPEIQYYEGECG